MLAGNGVPRIIGISPPSSPASRSDHALDAVDKLRQLRLPLDHDRQEPAFAFVGCILPGSEANVLDEAGEVLQLIVRKRREERNRGQLSDSNHNSPHTPTPGSPRSPGNPGYDNRTRLPSVFRDLGSVA